MDDIFRVNNLNFEVNGVKILDQINFGAQKGEYITITGPSGSGKSTFLRIIATLLTPTSGEILYLGQQQSEIPKEQYRKEVSYCFQQPSLFGETVRDNLSFPFEIRKQPFDEDQAHDALKKVDLPVTMLDKKIIELSGGEKQRVALIRNLMFTPKVLLMDEVTTGLDSETKAIVHQLIQTLNQESDVTILAITHDETEFNLSKRMITIKNGKLVGE